MRCRKRTTNEPRRNESADRKLGSAPQLVAEPAPALAADPEAETPGFTIVRINGSIVLVAVAGPG